MASFIDVARYLHRSMRIIRNVLKTVQRWPFSEPRVSARYPEGRRDLMRLMDIKMDNINNSGITTTLMCVGERRE